MAYQLRVISGARQSSVIRLGDKPMTIGRHEQSQVRIASSQVSRHHCRLKEVDGEIQIEDRGSSNGTFVNGQRIEGNHTLDVGDVMKIGPIQFRLETLGTPADASEPAEAPGGEPPSTEALAADALAFDEPEFDLDEDTGFDVETKADAGTTSEASEDEDAQQDQPEFGDDAVADFLSSIDLEDEKPSKR